MDQPNRHLTDPRSQEKLKQLRYYQLPTDGNVYGFTRDEADYIEGAHNIPTYRLNREASREYEEAMRHTYTQFEKKKAEAYARDGGEVNVKEDYEPFKAFSFHMDPKNFQSILEEYVMPEEFKVVRAARGQTTENIVPKLGAETLEMQASMFDKAADLQGSIAEFIIPMVLSMATGGALATLPMFQARAGASMLGNFFRTATPHALGGTGSIAAYNAATEVYKDMSPSEVLSSLGATAATEYFAIGAFGGLGKAYRWFRGEKSTGAQAGLDVAKSTLFGTGVGFGVGTAGGVGYNAMTQPEPGKTKESAIAAALSGGAKGAAFGGLVGFGGKSISKLREPTEAIATTLVKKRQLIADRLLKASKLGITPDEVNKLQFALERTGMKFSTPEEGFDASLKWISDQWDDGVQAVLKMNKVPKEQWAKVAPTIELGQVIDAKKLQLEDLNNRAVNLQKEAREATKKGKFSLSADSIYNRIVQKVENNPMLDSESKKQIINTLQKKLSYTLNPPKFALRETIQKENIASLQKEIKAQRVKAPEVRKVNNRDIEVVHGNFQKEFTRRLDEMIAKGGGGESGTAFKASTPTTERKIRSLNTQAELFKIWQNNPPNFRSKLEVKEWIKRNGKKLAGDDIMVLRQVETDMMKRFDTIPGYRQLPITPAKTAGQMQSTVDRAVDNALAKLSKDIDDGAVFSSYDEALKHARVYISGTKAKGADGVMRQITRKESSEAMDILKNSIRGINELDYLDVQRRLRSRKSHFDLDDYTRLSKEYNSVLADLSKIPKDQISVTDINIDTQYRYMSKLIYEERDEFFKQNTNIDYGKLIHQQKKEFDALQDFNQLLIAKGKGYLAPQPLIGDSVLASRGGYAATRSVGGSFIASALNINSKYPLKTSFATNMKIRAIDKISRYVNNLSPNLSFAFDPNTLGDMQAKALKMGGAINKRQHFWNQFKTLINNLDQGSVKLAKWASGIQGKALSAGVAGAWTNEDQLKERSYRVKARARGKQIEKNLQKFKPKAKGYVK